MRLEEGNGHRHPWFVGEEQQQHQGIMRKKSFRSLSPSSRSMEMRCRARDGSLCGDGGLVLAGRRGSPPPRPAGGGAR
jgi:hypothetical protein